MIWAVLRTRQLKRLKSPMVPGLLPAQARIKQIPVAKAFTYANEFPGMEEFPEVKVFLEGEA